jgi:hypothetical protein
MDTLKMWWEGADGSLWDLVSPLSPVFAVSIEGLGMPGFLNQWSVSGARDGQRYESTQWGANTITMVVQVGDTYTPAGFSRRRTGDDWRELDSAWRKSLSAESEGRLIVETETGGRRCLGLRLDAKPSTPTESNPAVQGKAIYVYTLTAGGEPFWLGDPITVEFPWEFDDHPFFSEDGEPDDVGLYVARDAATEAAQLFNPGDREAFPKWWAQGPFEEAHVGVGDDYLVLPISVGGQQRIYVDSYEQSITDETGSSLWPLIGHADPLFPALPADSQVRLHTSLIDAAEGALIGITLVPRYDGPW